MSDGRTQINGIYELSVDGSFSAGHCIRGYDGDCSRSHGHTYNVTVRAAATELDNLGMGVDLKVIDTELRKTLGQYDHYNLNDLEDFRETNPTTENIARLIFEKMAHRLNNDTVTVTEVVVAESGKYRVAYRKPSQ
jgi:6-pyruvoyltetrahydropterin/6-carboxytetrahydropterin synthase